MIVGCWLQVLARSSPEDELTLVSLLKKEGEVVAVTGGRSSSRVRHTAVIVLAACAAVR